MKLVKIKLELCVADDCSWEPALIAALAESPGVKAWEVNAEGGPEAPKDMPKEPPRQKRKYTRHVKHTAAQPSGTTVARDMEDGTRLEVRK